MLKKTTKNITPKDNYISLSTMNHTLYEIFNNKDQDKNLNIDSNSNKIINFFIISIIKTTKIREIKKLLKLNKKYYNKKTDLIIFNANNNIKKNIKSIFNKITNYLYY